MCRRLVVITIYPLKDNRVHLSILGDHEYLSVVCMDS